MGYEEFCTDYLLLNAERCRLFDLVRILCSNELQNRAFIAAPKGRTLRGFPERWLLFVSLLAQIIVILLRAPLKCIGSTLEVWLNYPSSNGGYLRLLLNILTGRVVTPDRSSATYRSLVANLDMRVELDRGIRKGDNRYDAALAIMAAKLSYENEAFARNVVTGNWQMEFFNFYDFWNDFLEQFATQAIIFQDTINEDNLVMISFRGTEPYNADDWITDVDLSWYEFEGLGKVHAGFMNALGLQKTEGWPKEIDQGTNQKPYAYYTLRGKMRNIMEENENARFIVTGHSLGAALAILFPAILILHEEKELLERLEGVYTFGQPRVGDKQFGEFMKKNLISYGVRYYRYVYANDIVPRVPFDVKGLFYKHFGPALFYNSCYKGLVLEEEPNKNYFSLIWVVPKYLNAIYEIIRSFIIPFTRGLEYREGWFQILSRLMGLVIPGLPDHGPQDYVNVTRLGTSLSSLRIKGITLQQQGPKDD